jgi:RNA polymerase sigma-70 factor (ECF subfamily)
LAAVDLGTPPVSDETLVSRARAGDHLAWDTIYERYYSRIYSFLYRRLANRADVEDAVQDVFLNVFTSLHTYRAEAPFVAWLFGLTRRSLASRFKKKRIDAVPMADEGSDSPSATLGKAPPDADPLVSYEGRERLERLVRAVRDELSEEQRTLFELRHLEHRSIQDIARETSRSEDAVKSHLYRARRLLLAV